MTTTTPEREALAAARDYVTEAATRYYDGTSGDRKRKEAERVLAMVNAALAASPAAGGVQALPENATEPMQKAMQRAVLLRKSMNDVWRAALSEMEVAATPPAAPAQAIRYDGLLEYAEKHRLDYNELCCVARTALASQEGAAK